MRILLLGKNGQLGWELHRTLQPLGNVVGLDFPQIDLRYPERLPEIIHQVRPELIVNATAYTAVDRAESEPETAMAVNARAPGVMAEEAT
jgi:dTDP-4-dehydrorhamnose reductase